MVNEQKKTILRERTDFLITEINRQIKSYGHVKSFLARELEAHLEIMRTYYLTSK